MDVWVGEDVRDVNDWVVFEGAITRKLRLGAGRAMTGLYDALGPSVSMVIGAKPYFSETRCS